MEIATEILQTIPELNMQQQAIVGHSEGPLLVIAGPGSGKTFSVILRTLNLLLLKKAEPSEIVLCTFTEKAAHEMQTRMAAMAERVGYKEDLSLLRIDTIHGICSKLVTQYRHYTRIGNNYGILDEFAQRHFIFKHLRTICDNPGEKLFLRRSFPEWEMAKRLQKLFNTLAEELIDLKKIRASTSKHAATHQHLAQAYQRYQQLLIQENQLCFSSLQKITYNLLDTPIASQRIRGSIRYVCVDEYQDTNHIQEQILLRLTQEHGNLCVIGDEDQALYRFRGATVGNILGFAQRTPPATCMQLTTNYRSHPAIIQAYDSWMASHNWSDEHGQHYRNPKTILPPETLAASVKNHPAVFGIQGRDNLEEARQFAEMVRFLKDQGLINDYHEVALLLHSVRAHNTRPYIDALQEQHIPSYCPRARAYFQNVEIQLLIASLAQLLDYQGEKQHNLLEDEDCERYSKYIQECIQIFQSGYTKSNAFQQALQTLLQEIDERPPAEEAEVEPYTRLSDYFYRLLALEPFVSYLKDEDRRRNIARFSQELQKYQKFYQHQTLAASNREEIKLSLFTIFLCLLERLGINEYEDAQEPFPEGHVQILTIHQAKGLEFPVVAVAGLQPKTKGELDELQLAAYYQRPFVEPEKLVAGFDMMRLYYVAFSRAEHILVLLTHKPVQRMFQHIWQNLPHWPYVQSELSNILIPRKQRPLRIKQAYGFTSHTRIYETCPRQYEYYCEYEFEPSKRKEVSLGLLVHQTLEEFHRLVLDRGLAAISEQKLADICNSTARFLSKTQTEEISDTTLEKAFIQVRNYFMQNQREIQQVIATEVDITHEEDHYILAGRVDLLMEDEGQLFLLDFKTAPRPQADAEVLFGYERQLCIYAHSLQKRYHKPIGGLYLYWTEEPVRADALMKIRYEPERVQHVLRDFSTTVGKIQAQQFQVQTLPGKHVCQVCDMIHICNTDGTRASTEDTFAVTQAKETVADAK